MYVPQFTCKLCNQRYSAQKNADGSYAIGLCPYCPNDSPTEAWEELVQQQRLERERRRKR